MLDALLRWFVILAACGVTIFAFLLTVIAISVAVNPLIIPN